MSSDPGSRRRREAAAPPAAEVLVGLGRALPLAQLFPATHQRFTVLADPLLWSVRCREGDRGTLTIEVAEDALVADGEAVGLEAREVRELHALLGALGLGALEIDGDATREALHALALRLLQGKRRLSAGHPAPAGEFESLPRGVRALPREFGRRVGGGSKAASEVVRLEAGSPGGPEDPGTPGDAAAERSHLGRIARQLADAASAPDGSSGWSPDESGDARRLEEVLDSAVANLERALGRPAPEESVDPREAQARDERANRAHSEWCAAEAEHGDEIEALCHALAEDAAREEPWADLILEDACEELAILLQLAASGGAQGAQTTLRARLRDLLAAHLVPQERVVVRAAVRDLVHEAELEALDAALSAVAVGLRRSRTDSFGQLLVDVTQPASPELVERVWPHAADELLAPASPPDPALEGALLALVGAASPETLRKGSRRLERLEAVQTGTYRQALLQPPRRELAELLAVLIEEGIAGGLAERQLAALRARPPAWSGAAAVHTLSTRTSEGRRFLAALVRDSARETIAPETRALAARCIFEGLEYLPPARRDEPWVAEAIAALGATRWLMARPLLQRIVRERRAPFAPAWPQACRSAAGSALRALGSDGRRR
jgi:hypothetical protein